MITSTSKNYVNPDILLFEFKPNTWTFAFDAATGSNLKVVKGTITHAQLGVKWSVDNGMGRVAYDDLDEVKYLSMWEPGRTLLKDGDSYWYGSDGLPAFKQALIDLKNKDIIDGNTIVTISYGPQKTVNQVLKMNPSKKIGDLEGKARDHMLTPSEKAEIRKQRKEQEYEEEPIVPKKPTWYSGKAKRLFPGYESVIKVVDKLCLESSREEILFTVDPYQDPVILSVEDEKTTKGVYSAKYEIRKELKDRSLAGKSKLADVYFVKYPSNFTMFTAYVYDADNKVTKHKHKFDKYNRQQIRRELIKIIKNLL